MDTQTRNELTKVSYVAASISPGPIQMIVGLIKVTEILLGWFSITVEVFVRFSFGSRYLSLLRLLLAWWTFQTYKTLFFFASALSNTFAGNSNPAMWLWSAPDIRGLFSAGVHTFLYYMFIYGFFGLSIIHLFVIWRRGVSGSPWHSMSFGISWMEFLPWDAWQRIVNFIPIPLVRKALQIDDWKLYCWLEPLLCYMAGKSLWEADRFIGSWLLIASVALFIKNNMLYLEFRGRALDLADSEIEARYLQAARQGADKRTTAGFTVVPAAMQFEASSMSIEATVKETLNQPTTEQID